MNIICWIYFVVVKVTGLYILAGKEEKDAIVQECVKEILGQGENKSHKKSS